MDEWTTEPLTEVLDYREGPGIMARDFRDEGIPLVRLAGLKRGAQILDGANYLDPEMVDKRWRQFQLHEGDTLLSTSASLGEVARVGRDGVGAVPYTGIISFRPRDERVDAEFIQHMLTTRSFIEQIEAMGVGSVMKHFGPTHLRHMKVSFPSRRTQRAIAEVLGALDDKIAANTRTARLADELVRAKYEALAGDPVPLGSIAMNVREQVDPRSVDAGTPYVGLEHVPRRSMWLVGFDTAAKVSSTKASFRQGDVLFGKLRPYFHKVVGAPFDGIASTDILVLRSKRPELRGLVLAAASSDAAVATTTASSEGTRMPRTKWADLAAVELPWPGEEQARRFSDDVAGFADWAATSSMESQRLAATRDELLPLLMSGKLRVKGTQKFVEGVL